MADNFAALSQHSTVPDHRGCAVRILYGKYAGMAAWKDNVNGETEKQVYVIIDLGGDAGPTSGFRVKKDQIEDLRPINTYEEFILTDKKVINAFRAAANAIAKADCRGTSLIGELFQREVDKAHAKYAVSGNWSGNLCDHKSRFTQAAVVGNPPDEEDDLN